MNAGELIKALAEVDDELAKANGHIRNLRMERDELVEEIQALMDEQGTSMLAAEGLVCERKEEEVPQLRDWSKFERWVLRHKRLDLLQRRVSAPAWREIQGGVPGIEVFNVTKLSVRKKGK